jgi:hypothetical protein
MVDFFDKSGIIQTGIFGGHEMKFFTIVSVVTALAFTVGTASAFTVTPSCFEKALPDTTNVLMCSNVGNAEFYIDNDIIKNGCIRQDVKAPKLWNYRQSPWTGRTQTIVSMGWGPNQYFWVVPKKLSDKCRRKWK